MRSLLLVIFSIITLTASAQFWQKKEKPAPRYDLPEAICQTNITISPATKVNIADVHVTAMKRVYNLDIAENIIMKEAKHNMRYRQYVQASYSFRELAHLYMIENRFSEAKWYLLQSNNLSRKQNDNKLTVANLIDLADIKATIGELALARTDLKDAQAIANANGMSADLLVIEKKSRQIELTNTPGFLKSEFRYAAAVEAEKKAKKTVTRQ